MSVEATPRSGSGKRGGSAGAAVTRRHLLIIGAAGAIVPWRVPSARASPDTMKAAMAEIVGDAKVTRGRVKLDLPPLAENGNSVLTTIEVDSPMTEADHVKAIYVFSEKNPLPNVARFHLGARAGQAKVQTSIRLADSQTITAIARMSDGSLWSDQVAVVVTLAACLEEG